MIQIKNQFINGRHGKPIVYDSTYLGNGQQKPLVIFAHGYKGYKDWGCWNLVAKLFAQREFFFVKFNFSHNGGTIEQPIDFPDLEAFGNNNLTKELDDLGSIIDYFVDSDQFQHEIDTSKIVLIGHSRGGGIVTLKAAEDDRIKTVVSWAGVSDFESRFPTGAVLNDWHEKGVYFVENSRTKQQMPHYYQFYEDFVSHKDRLNVAKGVAKLTIPHLIIHGTNDTSVPVQDARNLHSWNPQSELYLIEEGDHTFGSKQPWTQNSLTFHLQKVVDKTISFI